MGKDKKEAPGRPPGRMIFFGEKNWQKLANLAKTPHFLEKKSPNFCCFLECVATSLSSGYSFNDPVQKCFQLRRNLFESVLVMLSPVLQLATVQWKKQRLPPPPAPLPHTRTRLSLFRSLLYQTKSISTNAQYVTVQKYFSNPSFSS
jgi:hypothetical protein